METLAINRIKCAINIRVIRSGLNIVRSPWMRSKKNRINNFVVETESIPHNCTVVFVIDISRTYFLRHYSTSYRLVL